MIGKYVTMCKIAVELDDDDSIDCEDEDEDEEQFVFRYKNRIWIYLDFVQRNPYISLHEMNLLVLGKHEWSRKFRVNILEESLKPCLALCFVHAIGNLHYGFKKILPSLFYNAEENRLSLNYGHNRATKKYVTTILFDALYNKHAQLPPNEEDLELPTCFRPELCKYQKKAVAWLCQRERQTHKMPHFYKKLNARDNETSVYSHTLCLDIQSTKPNDIVIPFGGILADEMGLGKTVEMLALILLHTRTSFDDMPEALSTLKVSGKRRRLSETFCLCGFNTRKESKLGYIQCIKCEQRQHVQCVSGFDGEHDANINEPYACPQCWSDIASKEQQLVPSRATLIVTPNTIKLQWLAEIRKHVYPALRVFVYDGIAKGHWISPRQLANYDIVLTDYNVVRREVYHTTEYVPDRVTRKKPRQMRCNTPLLMIEWWRVCLDEAQMVESNVSNLAHLTFQIPAINRWAVTGTPIQSTIDDLHSLIAFVGFNEICYPRSVWDNLVRDFLAKIEERCDESEQSSIEPSKLIDLLQLCMWRTCKSKVGHELKIPPQTEEVHYVTLSNLEKLFYSEQHAACEENFNEKFDKYIKSSQTNQIASARTTSAELSPHVMKILLEPLLKIRQCCTIPVVSGSGGGGFGGGGGSGGGRTCSYNANNAVGQKKFLQPKDLHKHLKSANETECKSELRSMASSYNGIAAIYFIRKNYAESIRFYELVLKLARDYDGLNISVDSLLQIHALHNILQAYNTAPNQEKLLSSDVAAQYEVQCNKLEWKYLEPYASQMKRVQDAFETEAEAFISSETEIEADLITFVATLAAIISKNNEDLHIPLMEKIYNECVLVFPNCELMSEITSIHSALYVLNTWHDKVLKVQKALREEFMKLKFFTDNVRSRSQVSAAVWREMMQFVNKIYDCHLSNIRAKRKENENSKAANRCVLCTMSDTLNTYECLLFNKVIDKETNLMEGLANPSPQITLIKVIFSFTKSKKNFPEFASEFNKHAERIKCMQVMWKKMLKYWIEIEYTVKAYDELDMCKMRISLTDNKDEKSNFKLLDYEVDNMLVEQQTLFHTAQAEFTLKYARLKYILHLENNADPGACPICHSEDEPRYAVLECGHHICLPCLKSVLEFKKTAKLACSICRNQQNSKKIYYVTRTAERSAVDYDIKGNYSSKISYIVSQVLKLHKSDTPNEAETKILIFSQWEPILSAIAAALSENDIRYRHKWSPQSIEEFKNPHLGITCMLMPLSKGSKGLNLIEATHVFLVEPILNPAEELQAIGRVHRFGQTRPTTVHRFIVLNTIEENIYFTVTKGSESSLKWSFENMNLESLRSLFQLENDVYHSC